MKTVRLGYKAFDPHELACHFVAEEAGLYRERRLAVELRDTRFVDDDELPDDHFSVACGAALLRWFRDAEPRVVFVATDRPMFWLYGEAAVATLRDLRGRKLAGYAPAAPPSLFLRLVLDDEGLDPDKDLALHPVPDDESRLAMLRSGEAAAALLSSATTPDHAEELGAHRILCIGDRLRLPTTGLAVNKVCVDRQPETVAAMRDALRAAIRLLHEDEAVLRAALRHFPTIADRHLGAACNVVRDFFTPDGMTYLAGIATTVSRVAAALGKPPPDLAQLYGRAARPEETSASA